MIAFLWAQSQNGIIGKNGTLPWHLPADLHYFKTTTLNHVILAGRTTYLSFGRPLPQRTNLVLTHHSADEFPDNVIVLHTIEQFMTYYREHQQPDVFVVGGAQVYQQLRSVVDYLYVTLIQAEITGDTKMPQLDYDRFELIQNHQYHADAKNPYNYAFQIYRKK